jgi:hypothetical protein
VPFWAMKTINGGSMLWTIKKINIMMQNKTDEKLLFDI